MRIQFKKLKSDLLAVTFAFFGLFIGLSLFSFNPLDPSLNTIGQLHQATNWCGIVGSFLADALFQLFGLTAWAAPFFAFKYAFQVYQDEVQDWQELRIVWVITLTLCAATMLSLYLPDTKLYQQQISSGGLIGLGLKQTFVRVFNPVGLQLILWSLCLVCLIFYFEKGLKDFFVYFMRNQADFFKKIKTPFLKINKNVGYKSEEAKKTIQSVMQTPLRPLSDLLTKEHAPEEEKKMKPEAEPKQQDELLEDLPGARRRVVLKAKPPKKIENWKMPAIALLEDPPASRLKIDRDELRRKAELLTEKLLKFNIEGQIVEAKPGPLVTMYEFRPSPDVKISEISNLEDDLSLALSSESVRVMGQIPGTDVVGIETANSKRETVYYKDLLAEDSFWKDDMSLPLALGKQANGEPKIVNLRPMPHLLIAGTTGSGKSVFVRSIITGLLFKHSPKTLRLILIDPKMVDLADFKDIPHLALPHIIEPKKAVTALKWACHEMEKRYRSLSKFGAAKIEVFNDKVSQLTKEQIAEHEAENTAKEDQPGAQKEQYYYQPLPFIVIICDELADLMVTEKQSLEPLIQRLVQKARACGIHLIFATQSPRKEVLTGLIKTNIPARIALKVASPLDSRIILEETGAERLLPNGDMLYLAPGVNKPARQHGPYLSDAEVNEVVKHWSTQATPEYDAIGMKMLEGPAGQGVDGQGLAGTFSEDDAGEEYDQIVRWTSEQKNVSASLLQRRFQIGYPKAARFIELMERQGVIGEANGSKPRQVLVNSLRE